MKLGSVAGAVDGVAGAAGAVVAAVCLSLGERLLAIGGCC